MHPRLPHTHTTLPLSQPCRDQHVNQSGLSHSQSQSITHNQPHTHKHYDTHGESAGESHSQSLTQTKVLTHTHNHRKHIKHKYNRNHAQISTKSHMYTQLPTYTPTWLTHTSNSRPTRTRTARLILTGIVWVITFNVITSTVDTIQNVEKSNHEQYECK